MTRGRVDQNIFMRRPFACVATVYFSTLEQAFFSAFFKQQRIKASFASKYHFSWRKKIPSLHSSEMMWVLKPCALSVQSRGTLLEADFSMCGPKSPGTFYPRVMYFFNPLLILIQLLFCPNLAKLQPRKKGATVHKSYESAAYLFWLT